MYSGQWNPELNHHNFYMLCFHLLERGLESRDVGPNQRDSIVVIIVPLGKYFTKLIYLKLDHEYVTTPTILASFGIPI